MSGHRDTRHIRQARLNKRLISMSARERGQLHVPYSTLQTLEYALDAGILSEPKALSPWDTQLRGRSKEEAKPSQKYRTTPLRLTDSQSRKQDCTSTMEENKYESIRTPFISLALIVIFLVNRLRLGIVFRTMVGKRSH